MRHRAADRSIARPSLAIYKKGCWLSAEQRIMVVSASASAKPPEKASIE